MTSGKLKSVSFAQRPKRENRKMEGRQYTDFLLGCLVSVAGVSILEQVEFSENSPVDITWLWVGEYVGLSLGMECTRLQRTRFVNDGMAKAWLWGEKMSRFNDYERETGKELKTKIICVSEKKWSQEVDKWVEDMGFYLIDTGQINTYWQREIAMRQFLFDFGGILERTCKGESIAN